MVRKIGPKNIPDIEKYYNDLDEDAEGFKKVLEYQMDMINKYWDSMINTIISINHIGGLYPAPQPKIKIEPLFNIKGDEEE